jgi:hypothetical protein
VNDGINIFECCKNAHKPHREEEKESSNSVAELEKRMKCLESGRRRRKMFNVLEKSCNVLKMCL